MKIKFKNNSTVSECMPILIHIHEYYGLNPMCGKDFKIAEVHLQFLLIIAKQNKLDLTIQNEYIIAERLLANSKYQN